jgi:hypothetical protein
MILIIGEMLRKNISETLENFRSKLANHFKGTCQSSCAHFHGNGIVPNETT